MERELKYDIDDRFTVPDLGGLTADGRVEVGKQNLDSVYFDTDQRDLLASGVTLRCRTGTTDSGWQLKIPTGDARTEVRLDLTDNDTVVPTELAALVLGVRRGRALKHVVTVRTTRSTSRLLTVGGDLLVEIADDRVDAVAPGRGSVTLGQWREIEAELGPAGTQELLAAVDAQLIEAGATRSGHGNKVARALGPPDRPEPGRPAKDTAGEVIRAYLAEQDQALVMGDLTLRRGLGGIHPTRVATRRLRSTLRIFADYVQPEPAAALDAELSWYADLLGQVRDREVQRARFTETVADLPAELVLGPVAATIEQQLLHEQLQHQKTLRTAMNGRRYLALLRDVQRPGRRTQGRQTPPRGVDRRRRGTAQGPQGRETGPVRRGTGIPSGREKGQEADQTVRTAAGHPGRLPGRSRRRRAAPPAGHRNRPAQQRERLHLRPALRPRTTPRRPQPPTRPRLDPLTPGRPGPVSPLLHRTGARPTIPSSGGGVIDVVHRFVVSTPAGPGRAVWFGPGRVYDRRRAARAWASR